VKRSSTLLALLLALPMVLGGAAATTAISDGQLDGNDHPYVGLMVAQDGTTPLWRCSGTLLSPTLFLTAGHCTESPADHVEIWFDADVTDAAAHGYPNTGDVGGTPYTHPDYDPDAFFLHDVGVVVLDEPVVRSTYGTLPDIDQLDAFATRRGRNKATFTSVGYGLQKSFPDAAAWKEQALRIRMVAHPKLKQINGGIVGDYSLLLSNNAHSGGTCFGDSGGPNFLGTSNVIAGVTSFGLNGNCAGTGGVFRVDREDVQEFIESFQ
jgi:V8-like Glu-specific endopeptidase